MATISSTGVGSGLDVNSLVKQLVAAERGAADVRLTKIDEKTTTELTSLSKLKAALAAFQTAVGAMTTSAAFEPRKVTAGSDGKVFTATALGNSVPGRYDVEVEQIATAARYGSQPVANQGTAVGTGTLTLTVGTRSFGVTIGSENNTLAGIRDAINNAPANTGVRAAIIRDTAGARLVLTSAATGIANALTVGATGGDGGLQTFAAALEEVTPAQDAIVHVSGYEIKSASNTIDGAIDGVSLSLIDADPGETYSLDIARDDAAIKTQVGSFVTAFNTMAAQFRSLGGYDAATKTGGPMLGDPLLRGVETTMRRFLTTPVAGGSAAATLANLGITTNADGTLKLDSSKLTAALAADPSAATRMFAGADGIAQKMNAFIATKLSATGDIATRNTTVSGRREDLDKQRAALDARMTVIQARYLKQFTALDSMLSSMQTTSNYLTQQFSGGSSK